MSCVFESFRDFFSEDNVPEIFYVPETIAHQPVTEIKERAFYGCRNLKRVIIPDSVVRIGNYAFAECRELERFEFPKRLTTVGDYAFYNCMGLKEIALNCELSSIGYGAFKNCLELEKISMEIAPGYNNCLNSILQDEFQAVDVTIRYLENDGNSSAISRLIFTDYQYEYVPEIEARQFNWETYGSGDSYRISIRDTDIDYGKYDSVFPVAMVEDDEETLYKIAAGRLCWPYKLSPGNRERYEEYIVTNMPAILERIISSTDNDERASALLTYIVEHNLLDKDTSNLALDLAGRFGKAGITAQIMGSANTAAKQNKQDIHSRFAL